MLTIRFQRTGRKNAPSFRIIVGEHARHPKSEKHLVTVGSYHPKTKDSIIDADAVKHWLSKGAQPSGTVRNLLVTKGIIDGVKVNVRGAKVPPPPAATEGHGAPQTEAPVVE
jgi:small subunit ribosomal protein S16